MAKLAHSLRLEQAQWKVLEALAEEIPRQTLYPKPTVTQLIERAIDDYIGRLASQKAAFRTVINGILAEYSEAMSEVQRRRRDSLPKVLRFKAR